MEVEELSRKFHDIYQQEAKRQADLGIDKVRHPDNYDDLPERTKEYDRVLARYVIAYAQSKFASAIEEAAKVALSFTICDFDRRLAPMPDEEMKVAYKIAAEIRNLLNPGGAV